MPKRVSEITTADIANYLRLDYVSQADETFIETTISVAKAYIKNYTGVVDLDEHEDFTIAIYLLCQQMYDERTVTVEDNKINSVFETILGFHRVNLL